jgi:hypothetical protein
MSYILRAIDEDLYNNLLERGLIYPTVQEGESGPSELIEVPKPNNLADDKVIKQKCNPCNNKNGNCKFGE